VSAVDLLMIGGTGLAGRRIVAAARSRGLSVAVLARGGDLAVDVRDEAALRQALAEVGAATIVNSAAVVSLPECERDPAAAWLVNARPAAIIARHAQETGARFVQISTDHFYSGDGRRLHREAEPVQLVNEYARSKYAAEAFALTAPGALVLRTNFVGWPSPRGTSLAEWAMGVIEADAPADLYDDQYVSLLDVWTLAERLLDLIAARAEGRLNLGACEVFSKAELVLAMARGLGRTLTKARPAPVASGDVVRADSLGLDVSRAQSILRRALPTLDGVVANLLMHLEERRS
jgi:dTDP-4-dehydrorhamnose reductase